MLEGIEDLRLEPVTALRLVTLDQRVVTIWLD